MNTAVALYLIVGAVLFLIGDLANGVRSGNWPAALLAVVATIIGWPVFWGYAIWTVERAPKQ